MLTKQSVSADFYRTEMVTAGIRNMLRQRKPTRAPAETDRRPPAEKSEFPLAEPYADCQDVQPTATSVIEGMRQLRHKIFFPY